MTACPKCAKPIEAPRVEVVSVSCGCGFSGDARHLFSFPAVSTRFRARRYAEEDHGHCSFAYFAWYSTTDRRSNRLHLLAEKRGLNGTNLFRFDDPLFAAWFLARRLDYRPCRCTIVPQTVEQAAKRGVAEAIKWMATGRPPDVVEWIELATDEYPFRPDNDCELLGWGSIYARYNDAMYACHPGNPDRKIYPWQVKT